MTTRIASTLAVIVIVYFKHVLSWRYLVAESVSNGNFLKIMVYEIKIVLLIFILLSIHA